MISALAPKIIVAGGLAVVVGAIAVTVTLRSHNPAPVARISQPPAVAVQAPAAAPPVAPIPEAPAAVAPTVDATAAVAVAPNDNASAKIDDSVSPAATEPNAGSRSPAKARVRANASARTAAPESTLDSQKKAADETAVKNVGGVDSVEVPQTPPPDSGVATDANASAASNDTNSPEPQPK